MLAEKRMKQCIAQSARTYEGPSACAEGPSGYNYPRYAVTVRVGLDPHSP